MTLNFLLCTTALTLLAALLPRHPLPRFRLAFWQCTLALFLFIPIMQQVLRQWLPRSIAAAAPFRFSTGALPSASAHAVNWIVLGVMVRALWLCAGFYRLHRLRVTSMAAGPVRISPALKSPVSFGLFRPVILVGPTWPALSAEVQRAILTHERTHLDRHDWLFHLLEEAVLTVLWFHPAVWFLIAKIRLAREEAVDAQAIAVTRDPSSYIRALLSNAAPGIYIPAPAFATHNHLTQRIATLKQESTMSKPKAALSFASLALCLLLGATAAIWQFPLQAAGPVYKIGAGVIAPTVVYKRNPSYTPESKAAGVQGIVTLSAQVNTDGTATDIKVVKSLDPGLDAEAMNALQAWRFTPGQKDGSAVAVIANIDFNFRLEK